MVQLDNMQCCRCVVSHASPSYAVSKRGFGEWCTFSAYQECMQCHTVCTRLAGLECAHAQIAMCTLSATHVHGACSAQLTFLRCRAPSSNLIGVLKFLNTVRHTLSRSFCVGRGWHARLGHVDVDVMDSLRSGP